MAAARVTGAVACCALLAACAASAPATSPPAGAAVAERPAALAAGTTVRVDVSVATLWVSADSPRPVDRPALRDPVDMRAWLSAMSTEARRGLVGRVETQALYGEQLRVVGVTRRWLHVVAVDQPTSRDPRGYPGWIPRRQVTTHALPLTGRTATVVSAHTWLRDATGARRTAVGYGTRLPTLRAGARWVRVMTVTGDALRLRRSTVSVADDGAAALPRTRSAVLDDALGWRGVPYLWGGRSGWAVDCSGFTGLVYGVHGVRLPRDADDQATVGRAVAVSDAHRADLAFFTRGTGIGHVGFVAGSGQLLHAPGSGQSVMLSPLSSVSGLASVRRYLTQ
jgi:gamma-D-glutamyl-L-lysine dipeptidyl-peptidase